MKNEEFYYHSSIGCLLLMFKEGALVGLTRVSSSPKKPMLTSKAAQRTVLQQLDQYFKGSKKPLKLKMQLQGTEFQIKVWQYLQKIPYGQVQTYGEVAKAIGHPGAARAVGSACGKNQLLLYVPCHRVVATKGLGGFALGLDTKQQLLELEQN